MVIFGNSEHKICDNYHPASTKMERLPHTDICQCPVCLGTAWHIAGEAFYYYPSPQEQEQDQEEEAAV